MIGIAIYIAGILTGIVATIAWVALVSSDVAVNVVAAAPPEPSIREEVVTGFCGFLTADLPQLHGVHPNAVLTSWKRFKLLVESGWRGLDFGDDEIHARDEAMEPVSAGGTD